MRDPQPPGRKPGVLLLARHAQAAVPDSEGRFRSEGPVGLSSTGKRQAQELADHVRALQIDRVFASNMLRAVQTAEVIRDACGVEVQLEPGLREPNCGEFEGRTLDEIKESRPEFAPWIEQGFRQAFATPDAHFPADLRFPGGESVQDMAGRVIPVFTRIAQESVGKVSLIVSHAWVTAVVLCHVLMMPLENYYRFGMVNGGVSVVRVAADGRGMVDAVNLFAQPEYVAGGALQMASASSG